MILKLCNFAQTLVPASFETLPELTAAYSFASKTLQEGLPIQKLQK